jgi:hypothetical protein
LFLEIRVSLVADSFNAVVEDSSNLLQVRH